MKILDQKEINKKVYEYLYEIENLLDEIFAPEQKETIISEIEGHLKDKIAHIEETQVITGAKMSKILAEFGDPKEIVKEYAANLQHAEVKPVLNMIKRADRLHDKISKLSMEGEHGFFLGALIVCSLVTIVLVAVLGIEDLIVPNVSYFPPESGRLIQSWVSNDAYGLVYVVVIGILCVLYWLYNSRALNPLVFHQEVGDGLETAFGKCFKTEPLRLGRTLATYGLYFLFPFLVFSRNLAYYQDPRGLITVILFTIVFVGLAMVTDYRGIVIHDAFHGEKSTDTETRKAYLARKLTLRYNVYSILFHLFVVAYLFLWMNIALWYNEYGNYPSYPENTGVISNPFYITIFVSYVVYLIGKVLFRVTAHVKALDAAKFFGIVKVSSLLVFQVVFALFILTRGAVLNWNPFYFNGSKYIFLTNYELDFTHIDIFQQLAIAAMFFVYCYLQFRFLRLEVTRGNLRIKDVIAAKRKENMTIVAEFGQFNATCVRCGTILLDRFKYCPECGISLAPTPFTSSRVPDVEPSGFCPSCNSPLDRKDAKFCPECGMLLQP